MKTIKAFTPYVLPGSKEMFDIYPTIKRYQDMKKNLPEMTEREKELTTKSFLYNTFIDFAPATLVLGLIGFVTSESGLDYFLNKVPKEEVAEKLSKMPWEMVDYSQLSNPGLLDKLQLHGTEFINYANDVISLVNMDQAIPFWMTTAIVYASSKVILEMAKSPVNFLMEAEKNISFDKTSNKILDLIREYAGENTAIGKYSNVDILRNANRLNESLYHLKNKKINGLNQLGNFVFETLNRTINILNGTPTNINKLIKENNNIERVKSYLPKEDIDAIFPNKENEKHKEILYKINKSSLKDANILKTEDDFVKLIVLMARDDKSYDIQKYKVKDVRSLYTDLTKDYGSYIPLKFKVLNSMIDHIEKKQEKRESNINVENLNNKNKLDLELEKLESKLIDELPHLIYKKNETLVINEIPIESYYQEAFVKTMAGKIRSHLESERSKSLKSSSGSDEVVKETTKAEAKIIESLNSLKNKNVINNREIGVVKRTGYHKKGNDEIIVNDTLEAQQIFELSNLIEEKNGEAIIPKEKESIFSKIKRKISK